MNQSNTTRRTFIQQSIRGSLAIALTGVPSFAGTINQHQLKDIGLIVNVLESALKKDWEQTLRKVAAIGYTHLEFSGYYGSDITYFKNFLKQVGLQPLAGGASIAQMRKDELKKLIESSLQLDKQYLVCYWPWMDDGRNKKLDDFKKASEDLNRVGAICNNAGIRLALHNHDKEFVKVDGGHQFGYDVLMKETDPVEVGMLLDLYWCTKGGADATELLKKYPDRIEMLHVKDMDNTPDKLYTCPGYGTIDFKKVFAQAVRSGVIYYTVEIDSHPNPMKCIEDSYGYLKALRF